MGWQGLPAWDYDYDVLICFARPGLYVQQKLCNRRGVRNPGRTGQIGVISQKRGKFLSGLATSLEAAIPRFLILPPFAFFKPMVPVVVCSSMCANPHACGKLGKSNFQST